MIFTITPSEGKVISSEGIVVQGVTGNVKKEQNTDGAWTVTVPNVKSDILVTVTDTIGASAIFVGGNPLKGFRTEKTSYVANVNALCEVTATAPEDMAIAIRQATEENPVATVTVTRGERTVVYEIQFEITPDTVQAANPYLPLWEHIPDGEPHIFQSPNAGEGLRVYIYGSHDSNRTSYCGKEYVTWSAPVEDLTKWRYEGVIYSCADNGAGSSTLFAPDVAYKDGTYYLYVHDWGHGSLIRVATSDRPDGPFTYEGTSHDDAAMQNPGYSNRVDFDPAVFVDDDGRAYAYWGASSRHSGFQSGELEADMKTIKPGTQTTGGITMDFGSSVGDKNGPFHFFEAASVRKVEDMYVLVYSQKVAQGTDEGVVNGDYRGRLAYAYSDKPLGPWTYGGVIIDNGGEYLGNNTLSYDDGNNHGSIIEINGQWYVFYHRMTQNNENARQGMMEPIEVKVENGAVIIDQVEMTSQGANKDGLDAYRQQDAGLACYLTGGAYITSGYRENPDYNPIVKLKNNCTAGYKYFNFGEGTGEEGRIQLDLKPKGTAGTIDIYIDKPNQEEGTKIGSLEVKGEAGDYETVSTEIGNVSGKHAVYFVFRSEGSGEICEFNKFQFFASEAGDMVRENLNQLIAMIEEMNSEEYTAESWAQMAEALAAAKAVRDDAAASQEELDSAVSSLIAAFGDLEYGVQKIHLQTAIEAAQAILEMEQNYEDLRALAAAVENGKAVLADQTADQEAVDKAAYAILDELFAVAKTADVQSLESLIQAAKGLLDKNFTSDSLKNLQDAISQAEAVVADANRDQAAIGNAYKDLVDAIRKLERKGNKAALKAIIEKAEGILEHAEAYTASSLEGLEQALSDAKAVYDNEDAVQSEVNKAVETLTWQVTEARLLGDVDGNGAVTTSDTAAVLRASAELAVLSEEEAQSADVNGDGVADTKDAVLILQYAGEKISAF